MIFKFIFVLEINFHSEKFIFTKIVLILFALVGHRIKDWNSSIKFLFAKSKL